MKRVTRTVAGITLSVHAKYANTPIFLTSIGKALGENQPIERACSTAWAASSKEKQVASTINAGAEVLVVGVADKQCIATFIPKASWVDKGIKEGDSRKELDRLSFKMRAQLLNDESVTMVEQTLPLRRGITLIRK